MKAKILMVTMGLEIGGAETHIVELSKALKKRGYDILIASNGGLYVEELEQKGIRHFKVPLHLRRAKSFWTSYRRLKRILQMEKPDIVHAHARIPAFIVGLLRRQFSFKFVTTAHGVYDARGILRLFTNWGDRTLAVSRDIQNYLTDIYGIPKAEIALTVNGIDTKTFSPETSGESIRKEFALGPSDAEKDSQDRAALHPVICHVSRLDKDSSILAEKISKVLEGVLGKYPQASFLLVGGGTEYSRLSKEAEKLNHSLGRQALIMTGPRTDVHELLAACDLFVGVSRTALEAMSVGKPVILAGNAGFMGFFEGERLEAAKANNFTGRGFESLDADTLAREIIRVLDDVVYGIGQEPAKAQAKLKEIADYQRAMIMQDYSVQKMTDDYEALYRKVLQPVHRLLLSGYFGFNNAGDEAILNSIYHNLTSLDKNLKIKVLMKKNDDEDRQKEYAVANRFSPFAILKAIRESDILISGGGSLLQDVTSTKSILYYLSIINAAELMGKHVVLYANGIGPVVKKRNRWLVRKVVSRADLVTLRDENSLQELKDMGLSTKNMYVTADPVFTSEAISREEAWELLEQEGLHGPKKFVAVSVRRWKYSESFLAHMAQICDAMIERYGFPVVFVPMQQPNDVKVSEKLQKLMKHPSHILKGDYSTSELIGLVGCAHLTLSMRLHTIIFAASQGVPTLGIVYDPKVQYYLDLLGMPLLGDVDQLRVDVALEKIDDLVENYEVYQDDLLDRVEALRDQAFKNEQHFEALLERIESRC